MRNLLVLMLPGLLLLSVLAIEPERNSPAMVKTQPEKAPRTVLVIHGGAGVVTDKELKEEGRTKDDYEKVLAESLAAGWAALHQPNATSVDAVEAAIRVLEDSELYNAGRGAVFNSDGRIELDAAIMEGKMEGSGEAKRDPRKRAGAITGVSHIRNPISAARAVMEMEGGRHVMLVGEGAEAFAFLDANRAKYHIEQVSTMYFWTEKRLKQIREQYDKQQHPPKKVSTKLLPAQLRFGTVGAVAVDANKNITAGTSTGGMSNKWPGRVGDCPIIGAGTYADDRAAGVSCTGTGEVFIRHAAAHDVCARMLYGKSPIAEAVNGTIDSLPDEEGGVGGLIALDREGRHAFGISKRSDGMFRGYITEDGQIFVAMYTKDPDRRMKEYETKK